ncbi:hypothetical protein Bbelb_350400, partial [Branchiostoma belcheri]
MAATIKTWNSHKNRSLKHKTLDRVWEDSVNAAGNENKTAIKNIPPPKCSQKYDVEVDMSDFESLYENVKEDDLTDPRVAKMPVALKEYLDQHLHDQDNYDNDNGRSTPKRRRTGSLLGTRPAAEQAPASGDWTMAMRKVLKNTLHYVGEDPETYAASVQSASHDRYGTNGERQHRFSLNPIPTDAEPTHSPVSTSTPTPSSPGALLPVPKKRRLPASPRKPSARIKTAKDEMKIKLASSIVKHLENLLVL